MDIISYLVFVSFGFNLFFAFVLHFRSAKTIAHRYFELTAFAIAGWCLSMFMYRQSTSYIHEYVWAILLYFFPVIIPAGFLLFGLHFPNVGVSKRIRISIWIICIVMACLSLIPGAIIVDVFKIQGQEKILQFGWAYILYVIYIPVMFLLSYVVLFSHYRKSTSAYVRTQLWYILIALSVSSGIGMTSNLILPSFGVFVFNWMGQVATFVWVGAVTYAIIRHRLLDIRIIILRSIVYTALLLFLGLIYVSLFFFIRVVYTKEIITVENLLSSVLTVLLISFGFQPLRSVFEQITSQLFSKYIYDPNELLKKVSASVANHLHFDDMSSELFTVLHDAIRFEKIGLVLIHSKRIVSEYSHGYQKSILYDRTLIRLVEKTTYLKEPILIFDEMIESPDKEYLREHDISVLLPLLVKKELVGFLVLGIKKSGEAYSTRDIDVLKTIASEIAVGMKNILSYEEIRQFNITLRKKIDESTKELKRANEKLKELDKLKDEFVSVASHELRTPMTAIRSYLYLAMKDKKTEKDPLKRYLNRSYNSTIRLIKLVNDMLNISRIESGRLEYHIEKVDMGSVIQDVYADVKPRADELGLRINIPKETGVFAIGDSDKLKAVLINLIGNSLKFTPSGGQITVTVTKDNDNIITSVKDTGKGFSKEDSSKLFQKFGMLAGSYTTNQNVTQGTGLGLYICKKLIEKQGGSIWAWSEGPDKGAIFSFSLNRYTSSKFHSLIKQIGKGVSGINLVVEPVS